MKFDVEYIDTFAGETNYCWVNRETIEVPESASQALIMRAAKRAAGLSGLRGRTYADGDGYEFQPYRMCTVMYVIYHDE